MKRFYSALLTLPLPMLVMACAADTLNYPSLARRDAEKAANAVPPSAPAAEETSSDMTSRHTALVEQARTAHLAFDARKAKAERAVSAGGSLGSEIWGTATVALADLESARSDAMIAMADIDELYAAARIAGRDTAAIIKARDQISALIGEEDRVLSSLRARLAR